MKYTSAAVVGATMLLASMVEGHGFIKTPKARMPGQTFKAACGETMYTTALSDHYENVQAELQHANNQPEYKPETCRVWLCKGYKFADNAGNIQKYHPGQTVHMEFELRARHTGVANVSIVDTATDKIIGKPLISWDDYASNSAPTTPEDQLSFDLKMPKSLPSKCKKAGKCVIQHYWDAADINQTYESCVDFTWTG
ncbi:MAG: hypothetical protein M1831_003289 [Alyxoria varia]|nr:MAG: hypothetical protein M1831_003289 [Alyxoria varia]